MMYFDEEEVRRIVGRRLSAPSASKATLHGEALAHVLHVTGLDAATAAELLQACAWQTHVALRWVAERRAADRPILPFVPQATEET